MSKTYALITGASSGIGLEIARQLAARRMHVTLVARSGDVLEEVARELTERFGVDVRTATLDLSESDGCEGSNTSSKRTSANLRFSSTTRAWAPSVRLWTFPKSAFARCFASTWRR